MVLCIVKSSKLKPLFILTLAALLSSCAQTPPSHTQTPLDTQLTPETGSELPTAGTEQSAQQLYQQAKLAQGEAQQQQLLYAAAAALREQNSEMALAITDTLRQSENKTIRAHNQVLLLQAYLQHNELALAEQLIQNTPLSQIPQADQAAFLWASASLYQRQQRPYSAARSLLQLDALPQHSDIAEQYPELAEQLWQQLSALSHTEQTNLRVGAGARALGWLNLLDIVRSYLGSPDQLAQALSEWQQRNPQLPQLTQLPAAFQQQLALTPYQPERIAVLLPLSGQFQQHAKAIQYGLLAAATTAENSKRQFVFIDSQQPLPAIQQQLAELQTDFVIGPLLREQVDAVSQLPDWQYPTLFLNSRDSRMPMQSDRFYFALNMEDEASQMAKLFAQKNYQRPVVISVNNAISQRMLQQFSQEWQALGHAAPETHLFGAREELETLITSLLETDSSRERIRLISGLISGKVESEAHSRQDIDAIYLLANPVQTRMFKPFVDVSVNPNAPRLPIYASSRSYSTSGDNNDLRDLNGLTFTETPWLLGEQHSKAIREQYLALFPDQDETLQRLFAMGFDAYQLIGSLKQQQQLPSLSFPGFTGRLSVASDGTINRQLSWATYRNNRLTAVQEP